MSVFLSIRKLFHLNELRSQIIFSMVTVTLLPLFILTAGLYYFNYEPLIQNLFDFNRNLLDGNILTELTNEAGRLADQISFFISTIRSESILYSRLISMQPGNHAYQNDLLTRLIDQNDWVDYMVIRGLDDKVRSSGRDNRVFSPQLQVIVSDALLFQRTLAGEIAFSQPFRVESTDEIAMVLSLPILSDQGKPLGSLYIQVDLRSIQELTDRAAQANPGTIYVVDADGILLGHVNRERVLDREDMSELEIVKKYLIPGVTVGSIPYKNKEGEDVQGAYAPVKELNWGVVTERLTIQAFGAVNDMIAHSQEKLKEMTWASLSGMFFTGLLATGIGAFLAVRITSPIREISGRAIEFARGRFSLRFHVKASADIEQLAATMNYLGDEIERYTRDLQKKARDMRQLFFQSVESLAAAIDAKDPYTRGHSRRVTEISLMIGQAMNLTDVQIEELEIAALMHDVGKIGIDDAILKKPSMVNDEERMILQTHPVHGAAIMKPISMLQNMIPGMLHHHERWDGSGYPMGLKGDSIPLYGRVIAVADTFDAMTSDRPYQETYTFDDARDLIRDTAGIRYDPWVVESFLKIYPDVCTKIISMRR